MAEFDNEEMSRLKMWWASNGTALVVGAVLGLAIIIGWQGWRWYGERQADAAAEIYAQIQPALSDGEPGDAVLDRVSQLKQDYAGTPYAADAALRLAAIHVEQQAYDKARAELEWAMNNAANDGVAHIARVRAARLAWTQDRPEEALSLLDSGRPPAFEPLYAELAGDIHAAQGDQAEAHAAYQRALENLPQDAPRNALERKLADSASGDEAGASSEQNSG